MPYVLGGYNRFQDADGYPAVVPPWGTLNAIDLNTGDLVAVSPVSPLAFECETALALAD